MLMLIDEQNKKGGVLGKKLEAVVVDPASDWPLFAEKARELIDEGQGRGRVRLLDLGQPQVGAAGVRGAQQHPVLSRPVRGRGEQQERVLHRRRAEPAGDPGGRLPDETRKASSAGCSPAPTMSTRARPTRSSRRTCKQKGVKPEDIMINYTPFGHSDWQTIVADIKKFGSAGKKTAVVSTINGDANVPFYKELGNQGVKAEDIPVVAFSVGEEELAGLDTKPLRGPSRRLELLQSHRHARERGVHRRVARPSSRTTSASPTTRWRPTYIGFNMWVKAVEKAGTTDPTRGDRGDDRRRRCRT